MSNERVWFNYALWCVILNAGLFGAGMARDWPFIIPVLNGVATVWFACRLERHASALPRTL